MHIRRNNILLILMAGIILCFRGFYNHFPLFFWDTSRYIDAGFSNFVSYDRPMVYGLVIKYLTIFESIWPLMFCQGIILSLMLFYYFKYFTNQENKKIIFLIYIFIITFLTGASVSASQLMPDFFTSILILALGLLLMVDTIKSRDLIILSLLIIVSIAVHNSHFLITIGLLFFISVLFLFKKTRRQIYFLSPGRIIFLWILLTTTYLSVSSLNLSLGSNFSPFMGGHVFLLNRLVETGILEDYLDKHCHEKNYRICQYKDSIPRDFLWDKKSPTYKTGGWDTNKVEYNAIIKDILGRPRYLMQFIIRSTEASFGQFFNFETGDNTPNLSAEVFKKKWVYPEIVKHYPTQTREYLACRQNTSWYDASFINDKQKYVIAISLLVLFTLLFLDIPIKIKFMVIFFLLGVLLNAAVCGIFSGVYPRYQSRAMWLITLPVIIALLDIDVRQSVKLLFTKEK